MCKFCGYYKSSNGGVSGKRININKCANRTDITDCQIHKGENDDECAIIIFSCGMARGYFNIKYCPICGGDLRSEENERMRTGN